jgi:hypothetical protein
MTLLELPRPASQVSCPITNPQRSASSLYAAKEALRQEVKKRRERCSQKGTLEHRLIEEKNKQIDEDKKKRWHRRLRGERNGGTLKFFTPERLFPYDKVEKEGAKGGLDFHFMAVEVYRKHLFPYVRALAKNNPTRQVVILEDDDGSHRKARRLLAPEKLS